MRTLLNLVWEFPQMLAGFVVSRFCKHRIDYGGCGVYTARWLPAGVSLGVFIMLTPRQFDSEDDKKRNKALLHEIGHSEQSRILGPLYLLAVGLPSVVRNLYDRRKHSGWLSADREEWYYGSYPENWADKLGGVVR